MLNYKKSVFLCSFYKVSVSILLKSMFILLNLRFKMKVTWTKHSEKKLQQYQISKSRILRIIKNPYRVEEGIVPNTIALMRPPKIKNKTWKQEIWVMIQKSKKGLKIISAWRYPGKSPKQNPIPSEILQELIKEGFI